jgi:hypothetical protein
MIILNFYISIYKASGRRPRAVGGDFGGVPNRV